MKKSDKILTVLGVLATIIVLGVIIWFVVEFKEMLNDYRCSNLPLNEFFQDKECEKYWRYRADE